MMVKIGKGIVGSENDVEGRKMLTKLAEHVAVALAHHSSWGDTVRQGPPVFY